MHKRQFLYAMGGALMQPARAFSQDTYPVKPVQLIVGFPSGGAVDTACRVMTKGLSEQGLASIVVINKPGASATIAAAQVASGQTDGYSALLGASANVAIAPSLYPNLPYHVDDLVPAAQFGVGQNLIYANPALGLTRLDDLLKLIVASPGKFNYATPGSGTTAHLCFELMKTKRNLSIQHIPFRGSPAAITAVRSGELHVGIDAIGPLLTHVESRQLTPLAQSGERRSASLPDVPTLKELGISDIPSGTFLGFLLKRGTPMSVVDLWSEATARALNNPAIAAQLRQVGIDVVYRDRAHFGELIADEQKQWTVAVKASGAQPF